MFHHRDSLYMAYILGRLRVCSKISAGKNPLEYSGWIRPILATKTASGISAGWNS
jgi:S-adenosylmethionine synthetase